MGGWLRLSACVLTILLGLPGMFARAQDEEDAGPRLVIDRLGARSGIPLIVSSEAFTARDPIPAAYTAEGGNVAPPIYWTPGPRGTRSYVVIAEDADVRGGPHRLLWLVYDIPTEQTALGAGARIRLSRQRNGPEIARGKNSLGTIGYAGPRPTPAEGTHNYHFQVFALDTVLRAPDGASLPFVVGAMRGHVLAAGEIVGTFAASRTQRVASDSAPKRAPADEDMQEAPAKPEPVPDAPLKPAANAAETPAPTPPAQIRNAAGVPTPQAPAPELPMQIATAQPPPSAAERPVQITAPASSQALAAPPAPPAQMTPEPPKSAPARAASSASKPGARASSSEPENPLGPLLSLFAAGPAGPQPLPVAIWVSAYGQDAPKGPAPGSKLPAPAQQAARPAPPEAAPPRAADAKPADAKPAKAQPVKAPEPEFVPSVFPPIELEPLPSDAWRVASERIGMPALPDLPEIRVELKREPKAAIAAPTPTVAPVPTVAQVPPSTAAKQAAHSEPAPATAATVSTAPASKGQLASQASDLDFLKETRPPAATEPLPRPERVLVADLSFIRLPELPPVQPAPPPENASPPAPAQAPAPPAKQKAKAMTPLPEHKAEAEDDEPAPAKAPKPHAPRPGPQAPASEMPARPAGLAPAGAPPQATTKPRPNIPSLRPSSGARPDGAGG